MPPFGASIVQRAQRLFQQAADLPEAQQRQFLESACADDPHLLTEVMGMLEQDRKTGLLIDGDAAGVAHDLFDLPQKAFSNPRDFGPYRLLNVLGEGGMGVVWLAKRDDLGTLVAIKFLRDAWLSPMRRERFAVERRTLAQLNHSSIARLYDAGTLNDGTPWFAMEYVEGETVTAYCARHESTLRDRLNIFRDVCEAVQYAHDRAVIHRDLKPSNILVKAAGEVRLLDFGIAKQIEPGEPATTQTGLRLLTPAYAAPEQIRGEPTGVFTDVYALGVILYELLVGQTPYHLKASEAEDPGAKSSENADRHAVHQEPRPPSQIALESDPQSRLAAISTAAWEDLDVLCLTAIHKDTQRRYRSVEALIRDLDRFLKGEPLEARPDNLRYKTGKFLRRNLRTLSVAALALIVLLGLVAFFTFRLARARNTAEMALARSERVQEFMFSLFGGGDKTTAPANGLQVSTLIDRGANEAQALHADPEVQAALLETVGELYQKLGSFDRADRFLNAALQQRVALRGAGNADAVRSLVAVSQLRASQARLAEAEKIARDGLAKANRLRPANPNVVTLATSALAQVLEDRGAYEEAIRLRQQAVKLESLNGEDTARFAADLKGLADTQIFAGHYDVAESLTRRSLSIHRALFGDKHPSVAEDLSDLGEISLDRGYYTQAEQFFRQALALQQDWFGKDSPNAASSMTQLGQVLIFQKRYAEAESIVQTALAIRTRAYGSVHPLVANSLNELASVAYMRDQLEKSERLRRQVVDIYKAAYGDRDSRYAIALANLAGIDLDRKDYPAAERILRQVVEIDLEALSPTHLNTAVAQIKLGHALLRQKRYAEAEEHTIVGYRIWSRDGNPAVNWLHSARKDLAEIYDGLHQPEKAQAMRVELAHFDNLSTPPPGK